MGNIANNIRSRMSHSGLSAHALEKHAGLKNSAVQNILYGRSKNPSIKILSAIAQALDCEITDLLDDYPTTSLTQKTPTPEETSTEPWRTWNSKLYFSSFDTLRNKLQETSSELSKDKFLDLLDEIYTYSEKQNLDHPDEFFTAWLVDKGT